MEQTADLKMIADALFAQGVNHHIYHGMPYNPQGSDTIDFFASTYFGPGGSLTPELPAFNTYIETVSGLLRKGRTYSDVAVYLPYEDGVMKGAYPPERQRVWVWGEYEMRYINPSEETAGYHPLWINRHFLEQGIIEHGKLMVGDAQFSSLYIDVEYMDVRALKRVGDLARQGLPVCLKRLPKQPGHRKSTEYPELIEKLTSLPNVSSDFHQVVDHDPLIRGERIPGYWCREADDGIHYLFLAQWPSKDLKYPIYSGQSFMDQSDFSDLTIYVNGHTITQTFEFKPYQSLMLRISADGQFEYEDITFAPNDPVIRPREEQRMYF
jgi:hypothetical protein